MAENRGWYRISRMQVFAKRFWGFDPLRWPIVSFGLGANRDALVAASKPGDLIVFIGTQTGGTAPENRGRLLGLAEFGRLPIDSLEVLDPAIIRDIDRDRNGKFKWPKAIPMLRAWRFLAKPRVTEVLQEQLTYEATTRAVRLSPVDQAAVLKLDQVEIQIPDFETIRRQRTLAEAFSGLGPTTGPIPSSWTGTVTHDAQVEAFTYAFQFGNRNVWKVGHAQDVARRLLDVNTHVPHEVLGERWEIRWSQRWTTQQAAYEMEQRVFASLSKNRTEGERISCTEDELRSAWIRAMTG